MMLDRGQTFATLWLLQHYVYDARSSSRVFINDAYNEFIENSSVKIRQLSFSAIMNSTFKDAVKCRVGFDADFKRPACFKGLRKIEDTSIVSFYFIAGIALKSGYGVADVTDRLITITRRSPYRNNGNIITLDIDIAIDDTMVARVSSCEVNLEALGIPSKISRTISSIRAILLLFKKLNFCIGALSTADDPLSQVWVKDGEDSELSVMHSPSCVRVIPIASTGRTCRLCRGFYGSHSTSADCVSDGENVGEVADCVSDGENVGEVADCVSDGENVGEVADCVSDGENVGEVADCVSDGENVGEV
ncbi:unnamed protein product [Owenia fusiformis]|uniref:Uncharacterized protein n=1 Tax=Owenia fusiformis TaxID=6347 RepID=A0A8J1XTQ6_OWEFU|nr:unnamed protein product [Owenia fusiformis]